MGCSSSLGLLIESLEEKNRRGDPSVRIIREFSDVNNDLIIGFTGCIAYSNIPCIVWYKDGLWHRDDGPAYIDTVRQHWYKDNQLHRLDGPAAVLSISANPKSITREESFFIDGESLTKEQFDCHPQVTETKFQKLLHEQW